MRCEACKFFLKTSAPSQGECRRFPRAIIKRIDQWCGEFIEKTT